MRKYAISLVMLAALCLLSIVGAAAASPQATNVSAAMCHTVVLMDNGTVWTWGEPNTPWGILGTGGNQSDGGFHQVTGLRDIVAVDAGFQSSLAVDSEGRVWAWGDNGYGQCGNASGKSFSSPVLVTGLTNIVQASVSVFNGAAVDENGDVWAWGDNYYGQLGTGRTGGVQYTPVKVPISHVKTVSVGGGYIVALKDDGTVWAWGENDLGMVGTDSRTKVTAPVQVSGLSDIVKVDAGYDHTLALRTDGTVWAWGDGEENKIGNGQGYSSTVAVRTPVQVGGLPRIADIAAADHSSMVLDVNGSVWEWGSNGDGQYGNNVDLWTPAQSPVKVPGLGDVARITAGYGHCVVIKSDGTVWAWGRNLESQVQAGKGKKVLSPMLILSGGIVANSPATQNSDAAAGADIAGYVALAGLGGLVVVLIGVLVLLRLRK